MMQPDLATNLLGRRAWFKQREDIRFADDEDHERNCEPGEIVAVWLSSKYNVLYVALRYDDGCVVDYALSMIRVAGPDDDLPAYVAALQAGNG